jgi:hypothetical protein
MVKKQNFLSTSIGSLVDDLKSNKKLKPNKETDKIASDLRNADPRNASNN